MHNLRETKELQVKRNDFIAKTNSLIYKFGSIQKKGLHDLFQTYCCSFYGSQTWCLYDNNIDSIYTSWNIATRKILDLPYTTHVKLLSQILQKPHISHQIASKTLNLFYSMRESENRHVKFITDQAKDDNRSIVRKNLNLICEQYKLDICDTLSSKQYPVVSHGSDWRVNVLNEIIEIKDNNLEIDFEFVDLNEILYILATE